MTSHFFDLDTLLVVENQPWIVSKNDPNNPIMKISQSDFNLTKSGIYKSHGNKIDFNGKIFWMSNDLMNRLKVKSKNIHVDISNLAISMQEFINNEIIHKLDFKLNMDIIQLIKNTNDDIYIICSKNSKNAYDHLIKKMESKLRENGISVKQYYFISETFFNRKLDYYYNISLDIRQMIINLLTLK